MYYVVIQAASLARPTAVAYVNNIALHLTSSIDKLYNIKTYSLY